MIESVSVGSVASYLGSPQVMDELSTFNYLFGPNGSGKTTISRVLADEDRYPSCDVRWRGKRQMETMVYNRDFIDRNFIQSREFKGVFTLGEKQVDTLEKIAETQKELEQLTAKGESLEKALSGTDGMGGKVAEQAEVDNELKEKCWAQKRRHDEAFSPAFSGVRNSGGRFKEKVLEERARKSAAPPPLDDLLEMAETVFGPSPVSEGLIANIGGATLAEYENDPLLGRRIVGKEDAEIAALIQHLGNSDWVRRGRAYLEDSDGACPFCQQELRPTFAADLESYFDESYRRAVDDIDRLERDYATAAERIQGRIGVVASGTHRFLDLDGLAGLKDQLDTTIQLNRERLATKRRAPSEVVALEPVSALLARLSELIAGANEQAAAHNRRVSNLEAERATLTSHVWQHIVQIELVEALAQYDKRSANVTKAVDALQRQVADVETKRLACTRKLHALELSTTSIEPTIRGINALLESVGFSGFSIQQAEARNSYKLVREDGTDAKETLSEGERSFVTFLYFYHLIRGSTTESGVSTARVVVLDDPVSSLDSDVLFIVSSLIKGLLEDVRNGQGSVKQVFVLTHNVYFHREVTFNPRRRDVAMKEETFWVVRKVDTRSTLVRHPSNPVRTSYDLLWEEVRNPTHSSVTIQNSLRRILENYFTILGSVDPGKIVDLFEGRDRAICRSLFSWVNAGSHYAFDDLYVTATDGVENYLRVFRQVFEKSDQVGHYRMMTGDSYEDPTG